MEKRFKQRGKCRLRRKLSYQLIAFSNLLDIYLHNDHDEHSHHRHSSITDSSMSEYSPDIPNGHSGHGDSGDLNVAETPYVKDGGVEEFGVQGDLTEEVPEENKTLIWTLLKQVRPGMDLSKVVLPTFILEPRSFLDKLTDYYYHCDILTK